MLSTFDGISPVGDWTLSICDAVGSDLGTLTGWQIQILAPVLTGPELTVTDLYPCGDNEPNPFQLISLRVNNLGSVASDPTTAHFDYDGGTTTGSLAVPAIAPGGFFDVNFIAIIDLTAGPHTLVGSVDPVAGEANTANNTETCVPVGFQCYDQVVVAPGSWTEETIGDECTLRSGADYVFEVVIPYDASWSFSLCNGGSTWDTYLYLSSSCCGTILNSNDDYCGLVSQLSCIQLTTGVYFVDVEPFSSGGLGGTFTLDIFECIPGACCYGAGQCTEIPEEDCIALGGTFQGDGTLCSAVECPNPCIFECDVNAAAEGDDFTNYCETDGASDFNGGCNLDPPAYTEIQCGDIVCGNAFTCDATQVRDTDWYRFTTTGWNDVTVTAQAAFNNFVYGIVDISDCGVPFFISVGTITDCSLGPQSVTALTLPPGTYAVLGLYGDFTGLPVPSQYQLTLGCTPVAAPTGRCCYFDGVSALCATNTLEECDLLGGLWVSGIDCDTPCEIGRCCYNAGASCGDVTQAECDFLAGTWDEFLTCTSDPCPVPVDNDDCETAEEMVVVPGGSVTVLSGAAGATYTCTDVCTDDCGTWTSSSPDQFYFFTLTECRKIAIVTDLNAVHDSHISVYNDGECCGTPVLCNDDWGCNFSLDTYDWLPPTLRPLDDYGSEVAGLLEAGTYYIRAGHYSSGNWGEYELSIYDFGPCVNAPCDPINDLTAYPIPTGDLADHIQLMWTAPQDEDYTVWSTTNPNNDGNPDNGADADWVLEATLLGLTAGPQTWDGPATFGTLKFYVVTAACEPFTEPVGRCCYDGVCADLTHAACNDLGGVWTLGLTCVSDPCPVVPDNDDCIGAIEVLNGTPVSGSTALAVVGTDITSCTFNDIYDVWYYYVATTTDPIWVTLCDAGTTFDTGLAVFDACGGTEVACNDDDFITLPNLQCDVNGFASTLEFTPAAVGIFYIRVSGYDGDTGDFVLNVTQ